MATNFPSSLDTSTTIPAEGASTTLSTNHVTAHQNIQDAIEVIEAKIGVDSSAVTTSHDYKLSEVTSTDKAVGKTATQTLTNKTLTAAKVPLGSDAVGDMRYTSNADGTQTRIPVGSDNQILKLNGTTPGWEAETVVVAATEAVEGISRLATASQITAGTASEASYPLVVTPDQLALSTPVFDGSGLTSLTAVKKLSAVYTDVAISSSVTETDLISQSIAGGTLSTSNGVRVKLYFSALNLTSSQTCTIRFKYGATTVLTITPTTDGTFGAATGYSGSADFILLASGATGTQNGAGTMTLGTSSFKIGNGAGNQTGFSSGNTFSTQGTAAEDSTGALTLKVTAQFSNNGANDNLTMTLATIETIK